MDSLKAHASGKASPFEIFQLQAPMSQAKRRLDDSASGSVPYFDQPSKRQNFYGASDTSERILTGVRELEPSAFPPPSQESSWSVSQLNDCLNAGMWGGSIDVNATPAPHEDVRFKGGEGPSHYFLNAAGNTATSAPRSYFLSGDSDEAYKTAMSWMDEQRAFRRAMAGELDSLRNERKGESDLLLKIATMEGERQRSEAHYEEEIMRLRSKAAQDKEGYEARIAEIARELAEVKESEPDRENKAFNRGVRSGCEMLKEAVSRVFPTLNWPPIINIFQSLLSKAAGVSAEASQQAGDGPGALTETRQP